VHAGAVAVGLNTKLSEAEYRHIRADSGARLAIVEDVFASARPDLTAEHASDGSLVIAGQHSGQAPSWRDAMARAAPGAPPFEARAEDPAFWLYSSGTTGKPKGIIHAHRSLLPAGQAQREVIGLAPGEKTFATSKLFFSYSLEHGLLGPLATGATAILEPDWPDAQAVLERVERHRPHVLQRPPSTDACSRSARHAWRRSATCAGSSPPGRGSPRSCSSNGAKRPGARFFPSTACPRRSAPAS
jgi:benzoate-CoA ligase